MGDLISRKVVIDILKQSGIIVDNVRGNLVIEEINRIPTAYDVNKVVEQLSNKMFSAECYNDDFNGCEINNLLCMGDVYEIVKGAVKDE